MVHSLILPRGKDLHYILKVDVKIRSIVAIYKVQVDYCLSYSGCEPQPLGMASGTIADCQITASTAVDNTSGPTAARPGTTSCS